MDKTVELLLKYLTDFKAKDVSLFDVREVACDEDYIILANFASPVDNKLFSDLIMKKFDLPDFPEGYNRGEWIIIVLGRLAVHTFIPVKREKYNLDKLYQNQKVQLPKNKAKK